MSRTPCVIETLHLNPRSGRLHQAPHVGRVDLQYVAAHDLVLLQDRSKNTDSDVRVWVVTGSSVGSGNLGRSIMRVAFGPCVNLSSEDDKGYM
jgi:hypothetical protein